MSIQNEYDLVEKYKNSNQFEDGLKHLFRKSERFHNNVLWPKFNELIELAITRGEYRQLAFLIKDPKYFEVLSSLSDKTREKAHLLNNLGKIARRIRLSDVSISLYQNALSIARILEDNSLIFTIRLNQGNLHLSRGEFEKAKSIYAELLEQPLEDENKGLVNLNLGSVLYQMGDIEGAEILYKSAIKIFSKMLDYKRIASLKMNLGAIALNKLAYDLAISLFNDAKTNYNKIKDERGNHIAGEQILKTLLTSSKQEEAKNYGVELLNEINWKKDARLYARIGVLVSKVLPISERVKTFTDFVENVVPKIEDPVEVFQILFSTTTDFVKMNVKYQKAEDILLKLLEISKQLKDINSHLDIQIQLMWNYYNKQFKNK